jgi:hypothetical protein
MIVKKFLVSGFIVSSIILMLIILSGCPDPGDRVSPAVEEEEAEQMIAAGMTNTGVVGYVKIEGRGPIIPPPSLKLVVSPADNPLIVEKCYKFEVVNPPIPGTYRFSYSSNDFDDCNNGGTNWIALRPLRCGRNLNVSVRTPEYNGNIYIYTFAFEAKYGDIKKPDLRYYPGPPFQYGKEYIFTQPYIDLRADYDIIHSDGFKFLYSGWNEGGYHERLKAVDRGWHWVQAVAKTKECSWQEERSARYWFYIC